MFPGQGVQSSGMSAGLTEPEPEIFATASDVLGTDVVELCETGESQGASLDSTRWTQPAIFTCSVASHRRLTDAGSRSDAVVGHSIGEYSALVAAGAIDFADALRVVALRAEVTDQAARATPGTMAAVMRIERAEAERIVAEHGVVLAADNGPGQLVISGALDAVARSVDALEAAGATCRRVDVAGAFHSPFMESAAGPMAEALEEARITEPSIAFWSTTRAGRLEAPADIRSSLVEQLTGPVRWHETILAMASASDRFTDVGPGRVVAGLVKRIVKGADIRLASELVGA